MSASASATALLGSSLHPSARHAPSVLCSSPFLTSRDEFDRSVCLVHDLLEVLHELRVESHLFSAMVLVAIAVQVDLAAAEAAGRGTGRGTQGDASVSQWLANAARQWLQAHGTVEWLQVHGMPWHRLCKLAGSLASGSVAGARCTGSCWESRCTAPLLRCSFPHLDGFARHRIEVISRCGHGGRREEGSRSSICSSVWRRLGATESNRRHTPSGSVIVSAVSRRNGQTAADSAAMAAAMQTATLLA